MNSWDYLGNGILHKLVKNVTSKQFCRLDRQKMNTLPEIRFFENSSLDLIQRYKQFYFQNRDPEIILNKSKSVVMLHNSWTPMKYKLMSEKQFLNQDILLSRLLAYILKRWCIFYIYFKSYGLRTLDGRNIYSFKSKKYIF